MKKFFNCLALVLISLLFAFSFSSCEQALPEGYHKTPTIKGVVSLPSDSGVNPDDVWIKLMSEGETVSLKKASSDASFVFENLDSSKKYNLAFSTVEPEYGTYSSRALSDEDIKEEIKEEIKKEIETNGLGGFIAGIIPEIDFGKDLGFVKMVPLGTIKGKVTCKDLTDNAAISVFIPGTSYIAMTDSEGNYSICNVPQGSYSIRFSFYGYLPVVVDGITLVSEDKKTNPVYSVADTELIRNEGILKGCIRLNGSDDYSKTMVKMEGALADGDEFTFTDSEGSFSIPRITPGTYTVVISHDGYVGERVESVAIKAAETYDLGERYLKKQCASVSGCIQLEGKEFHDGVILQLLSADKTRQYPATTQPDGSFAFFDVIPGSYTLLASRDGYKSVLIRDIDLSSAEERVIGKQILAVARRAVVGSLSMELKDDYSGAQVTATNLNDPTLIYSALTNSDGKYSLMGLAAGEYLVSVSYPGYETVALPTVNVIADEVKVLDSVEMPISKGYISGLVKLEGRPDDASGVLVSVLGTEYSDITDVNGEYTIELPSGNYPGGLRFTHDYYEVASHAQTVTVLTNSTYGIPDKSMVGKFVDVVGSVEVKGTDDYSNVSVTLDGYAPVVTEADGTFRFTKVPVGDRKLSIKRENTPAISTAIKVRAGKEQSFGPYRMIPDSSSICGHVMLDKMDTHEGITVTVETEGMSEYVSEVTNSTGYFYISNILSSGKHTVTFSKPGWDSPAPIVVEGLPSLETTDITPEAVYLKDNTLPVIKGIKFNGGVNTTNDLNVRVSIDAFDEGSGVEAMLISWLPNFNMSEWQVFKPVFDCDAGAPGNGIRTILVKIRDKNGNESIGISKASITVTDQIRTVGGPLQKPEDLHWTVDNNPYVVSETIIVPPGKKLVIDPGVDVLFNGPYSIVVKGELNAVGTDNAPIIFRRSGDDMPENLAGYYGNWGGIHVPEGKLEVYDGNYDFDFVSGSIIKNCDIRDLDGGITGKLYIDHCHILSSKYAIGNEKAFNGYIMNSDITGAVRMSSLDDFYPVAYGNTFTAVKSNQHNEYGSKVRDCYFYDVSLINNKLNGFYINIEWLGRQGVKYNTFDGCSFGEYEYNTGIYQYGSSEMKYNEFCNMVKPIRTQDSNHAKRMNFNNFHDNIANPLVILLPSNRDVNVDWRYNYWGDAYTRELDNLVAAGELDASFIHDFYEDYNLGSVDWSDYVHAPWPFAGYQGDKLIDYSVEHPREYYAPVGETVYFRINSSRGVISEFRAAASLSELLDEPWQSYSGRGFLDNSKIDLKKVNESGCYEFLVQGRSSDGYETPITTVMVPYRKPVLVNVPFEDGTVFSGDNNFQMDFGWSTPYGGYDRYAYIGDSKDSIWDIDPTKMKNGSYTVRVVARDIVGNESEELFHFIIDRPVPEIGSVTIDKNVSLAKGETLEFDLNIVNSKHLKSYRVFANDNLMKSFGFADNGQANVTDHCTLDSVYLPVGTVELSIELEDFAGNVRKTRISELTVTGEDVAPVISGIAIDDGHIYRGNERISLGMTATDEGGIRLIDIKLNDKQLYVADYPSYTPQLNKLTPICNIILPKLSNGSYKLDIVVKDFAGNETRDVRTFIVDRPAPMVSAQYSIDTDRLQVSTQVENAEYLKYLTVMIDGVQLTSGNPYRNGNSSSYSTYYEIPLSHIPVGDHKIWIEAEDQGGNTAESEFYDIHIDGYVADDFGLGRTWNADGTLVKDLYTRFLLNFEDRNHLNKEVVSNRGWATYGEFVPDGVGNGSMTGVTVSGPVKVKFYDRTWTLEFWSKNEALGNVNLSMEFCGLLSNFSIYKSSIDQNSYLNGNHYYSTFEAPDELQSTYFYENDYSRAFMSEWHHYALVSTGTSIVIYVDGIPTYEMKDIIAPDELTSIYFDLSDNVMIDELRVSDRERTQEELFAYVQYVRNLKNW